VLIVALGASASSARYVPKSIEITPFYGYQWGGGSSTREGDVNLKGASNVGVTVDMTLLEEWGDVLQFEFFLSRQSSRIELERYGGGTEDGGDLAIEYYHGGILYQFDSPNIAKPFALVSLGATRAAPAESSVGDEWYVSFAFGGGVKFLGEGPIGVRLQGRLLFPVISSSSGIWCGLPGSCGVHVGGHVAAQADVQAGLIFGL
jgi:hypothetical protein